MIKRFFRNNDGVTAVEMALTAPAFCMLVFGAIQIGYIIWTKVGLQRSVEVAARCASINKALCGSTAAIQNYAVQYSFGVNPPPTTFSVSNLSCGTQVSATRIVPIFSTYFGSAQTTINARSCFPSS